MKKQLQINSRIPEFLTLIFLAMALLFFLSSCATEKALQYAKEKASPDNVDYWKIKSVASSVAVKQENGDISVCIELETSSEPEKPILKTITLPMDALTGESNTAERIGLHIEECPFGAANCFWYPIGKAQDGCDSFESRNLYTSSVFPIEKLEVNKKSQNQLYDLIDSKRGSKPVTEKIYEVRFIPDDKPPLYPSPPETIKREKEAKYILLIYWPEQLVGQQSVQPISIAGTYKDKSTGFYYILVPPAFIVDFTAVTFYIVFLIWLTSF